MSDLSNDIMACLTNDKKEELLEGIKANLITAELWKEIKPAVRLKFPINTKEHLYMFEKALYYADRILKFGIPVDDKEKAKMEELLAERDTAINIIDFIIKYDLVHLLTEGVLCFRQHDEKLGSDFIQCNPTIFIETKMKIFKAGKSNRILLFKILSELDRTKHLKGISFTEMPLDYYNLAPNPDLWLQPLYDKKPTSKFFDVLFESLVPDFAVRRRLWECIAWKYLHPEEISLPNPIFCGVGGVGKSGVGQIFRTIFGYSDVSWNATINDDSIKNTGFLVGKVIVNFDDLPILKRDSLEHCFIKTICHNKTFKARNLYIKEFTAETTAWVWFNGNSSNDEKCPVPLTGDGEYGVDRRFMPIILKEDLVAVVMRVYPQMLVKDTQEWIDNGFKNVLCDREEVARWLGQILKNYTPIICPKTIHSEDYKILTNPVSYHIQRVCDFIMEQEPTFISTTDAWDTWKAYAKDNINEKYANKKNSFISSLTKIMPEEYQLHRWNTHGGPVRAKISGWAKSEGVSNVKLLTRVPWLTDDGNIKRNYDL